MTRPRNPSRRVVRGFGLIEVMISATLLALGMAATLTTLSALDGIYAHERLITNALHVGESTMEGLLLRYADDPALLPTNGTPRAGPSFTQAGLAGGSFFATAWEVDPGIPIVGTRQLTVTVSWTERGQAKTLKLTSVRT